MSLTSLIAEPGVAARMQELVPLPDALRIKAPILAPPRTQNWGLIGTAFDYLLRFELQRRHPGAVTEAWVAEHAIERLPRAIAFEMGKAGLLDKGNPMPAAVADATKSYLPIIEQARRSLETAKTTHGAFIGRAAFHDSILPVVLDLAQLDGVYRASRVPRSLGRHEPGDLDDLRALLATVPQVLLDSKDLRLNPTFGIFSGLVGGADADLVLDGALIDIKTVKDAKVDRDRWAQIVGYLILSDLDSEHSKTPRPTGAGFYFARHGLLVQTPAATVYESPNYAELRRWFVETAEASFGVTLKELLEYEDAMDAPPKEKPRTQVTGEGRGKTASRQPRQPA